MFYSAKDIKRIEDFEKYARFLCEHFDISVELDSTKAQTNGKVINLPNVVGLTDSELDMMYAILLHEVGHIKYSSFAEEDFALLKTEHHAYLANAIEDARIENLLMKEFAGARDMFDMLYVTHVQNKDMMQKVFKFDGRQPDLFASLGIYIHNLLVHCETADLADITTKENVKQINLFFKLHSIDTYLAHASLSNWQDVVSMTNHIYDLFIARHRDDSKKTDFAQSLAEKNKVQKALDEMKAKLERRQAEMQVHQNALSDVREKANEWHEQNDDDVKMLEEKISALEQQISKVNADLSARRECEKTHKAWEAKKNSMAKQLTREQKMQAELNDLQERQVTGQTKTGRKINEEVLKGLQEKLEKKQAQLNALEKSMQADKQKVQELQKAYEQAAKKDTSMLSEDALKQMLSEKQEQMPVNKEQYNELTEALKSMEKQMSSLESLIKSGNESARKELLEKMYQMDEIADKQGLPVNMLPEFVETPGWESADDVQREMDKKLSSERDEIVRNGERLAGALGSNIRDMGVYVDKKAQSVKEINLLDIFKSRVDFSLLPDLNETVKVTKTTTDKSIHSSTSRLEKHTVLTTQFDTVRQDVRAQNMRDYKDLSKNNAEFATQMRKIFLNKFKFAKKDRFRGGKEEGQLDSRNLWKLATRQGEDFFEQNQPKLVNKMAASIVVDISGSQDKEESAYGEKIKALVYALSEALDSVHVKHEVLGYHAPVNDLMRSSSAAYTYNRRSNSLETVVYKNFKQKENTGIANIELQLSDNSDGESLRIALRRLKRETAKSRMMFVVFDGKPFLSDGDVTLLDEDLRLALREAVKDNIQVFAFGFCQEGGQFFGERYCQIRELKDALKFIEKIDV